MAVATSHWGQGIGSALLQALLAEAAGRGCAEIFLEVRVDNPRAQQLYRRHGFTDAGLRRGYYQPSGTDALVMRRPLDPPATTAPATTAPAGTGSAGTGSATTAPATTAPATTAPATTAPPTTAPPTTASAGTGSAGTGVPGAQPLAAPERRS
jgi:ribosomal-protein-alanine N-acetyltransferase